MKKTKGISLVALVITIIVLIILTGTVVMTFFGDNILARVREAVFKNDMRTYQEMLVLKRSDNQINAATGIGEWEKLDALSVEEIKEIIPEFKDEYKDIVAIINGELVWGLSVKEPYEEWLTDLGIKLVRISAIELLDPGEYVKYNLPAEKQGVYNISTEIGANATDWVYNVEGAREDRIDYQETVWKVLKNDGNTITLVSVDAVGKISLYGPKAFVNGPTVLDEICEKVYGGRNLNIEDVNEVLKGSRVWGDNEVNWKYYSGGKYQAVPAGVKTIAELETTLGKKLTNRNTPETGKKIEDYAPNYYSYVTSSVSNVSDEIKGIISTPHDYWLSSNCVRVNFDYSGAYFDIYSVAGSLNPNYMYYSRGLESGTISGLRPVIVLDADVQVMNQVAGGGKSLATAWEVVDISTDGATDELTDEVIN